MNLKLILHEIQSIENISDIEQVIDAAVARRSWLESRKGDLCLTLIKSKWFAMRTNDPQQRGFELGERLGMTAMLRLAREKAPSPRDYEISRAEAMILRDRGPSLVGRWEENDGTKGYYRQAEYEQAARAWAEDREHLKDERAAILRLGIAGMRRLHQLEAQGYTVLFGDE